MAKKKFDRKLTFILLGILVVGIIVSALVLAKGKSQNQNESGSIITATPTSGEVQSPEEEISTMESELENLNVDEEFEEDFQEIEREIEGL